MYGMCWSQQKSESSVNESENLTYFGFAENCQNPTMFGFELRHKGFLSHTVVCKVVCYMEARPGQSLADVLSLSCARPVADG